MELISKRYKYGNGVFTTRAVLDGEYIIITQTDKINGHSTVQLRLDHFGDLAAAVKAGKGGK